MAAEREVELDPLLERGQAQRPRAGRPRPRRADQRRVGQRRPAEEARAPRAGSRGLLGRLLPGRARRASRSGRGRGVRARARSRSPRPGDDHVRPERAPQLGDVDLQRLDRGGRRMLAPQRVDQAALETASSRWESSSSGQQRALPGSVQLDRPAGPSTRSGPSIPKSITGDFAEPLPRDSILPSGDSRMRSPREACAGAWSPWRGNSGGPLPERTAALHLVEDAADLAGRRLALGAERLGELRHPQLLQQPRHLGQLAAPAVRPPGQRSTLAVQVLELVDRAPSGRGRRPRSWSAAPAASRRRAGSARRRPAGARRSG